MQVIVLGTSLETALALDVQTLDQQISLCEDIIERLLAGNIDESIAMYKDHLWWLEVHCNTLDYYRRNLLLEAAEMSYFADRYKPSFINEEVIKDNFEKFC